MGGGEGLWARGLPGVDLLLRDGASGPIAIGTETIAAELRGRAALVRWQDGDISAIAGYGLERLAIGGEVLVEVESGSVDFCWRKVGDQAVVEGSPARIGLRIPGVREVREVREMRGGGRSLEVERRNGALWLTLGPEPRPPAGGHRRSRTEPAGAESGGML
jgi:hypothetical protein